MAERPRRGLPARTRGTSSPRWGSILGAALGVTALAGGAHAGTFDEMGRLSTEESAFSIAFDTADDLPEGSELALYDASYSEISEAQLAGQFLSDPEGLEGEGALEFGGNLIYGSLALASLPDELAGRRVAITTWQRPRGTQAALDLYFYGGDYAAAVDSGDTSELIYLGSIPFRPTGRVTSDGWEEWSTGPFDFEGPEGARPSLINFHDAQLRPMQRSWSAGYDPDLRASLDALEVHDLGPAVVPDASCTLADETEVCGDHGLCLYGRCVDAAIVSGPAPIEAHRADYVTRRLFEYATFSGGRVPLQRMDELEAALEPLKEDPASARFWPTFHAAVADLRDGHASSPYPGYPAQSTVGVCAHLGEADLLPEGGDLPLVFETGPANPITELVEVGDVITAIDGLPPAAWSLLAGRLVRHPGDPAAREVITAPQLLDAAAVAGSVVEISRCETDPGAPMACDEASVERFEIDLGEVLGELMWSYEPPAWRTESLPCDFRFTRPVDDPDVKAGSFAGWADDEDGVRSLLINAVPALYGEEGTAWGEAVRDALTTAPEKVILDQRLGNGGSVDAVDLLAGLLVDPASFSHMHMLPAFERTFDEGLLATLESCAQNDPDAYGCGAHFRWGLGETIPAEEGLASATKLAILIGSDVSGNDYTTKLLSYRSAETRIFGPAPTWGAFGVIWQLPPWQEEMVGGSFQVHDTLFVDDTTDPSMEFTTGTGVPPDEVVLQTQSDAVAGRDTILEAARAWLAVEQGG